MPPQSGLPPISDKGGRQPVLAQVVEVTIGPGCQPLKLDLAVDLEPSFEDVPHGRAAESFVRLVNGGQQPPPLRLIFRWTRVLL